MKMKLCKLLPLVLALVLLAGCSSAPYRIVTENDGTYLVFRKDAAEEPAEGAGICQVVPSVFFQSADEMIHDIQNGTFSETEMIQVQMMYEYYADETGRLEICDLTHLYEPVCPESLNWDMISWHGRFYSYLFRPEGEGISGYFKESTPEDYDYLCDYFRSGMEAKKTDSNIKSWTTSTDSTRNAAALDYEDHRGSYRLTRYSLQNSGKTLEVLEYYEKDEDDLMIHVAGCEDGRYFTVWLKCGSYENRPSTQWLLEFGIRDYAGK